MLQFKQRLKQGKLQVGTFVKTPAGEIIELLALAGLDFVCLDAEHAPFGRRELDLGISLCLALGMPALVRLEAARPETILQALDSGASGVLVPHVKDVAMARDIARWARFGEGGRGYAGSTRAAGFATRSIDAVLQDDATEPMVVAQIEDPSALGHVEAIAAVEGLDALFFGAADLTVGFGASDTSDARVKSARQRVAAAAKTFGKPLLTFAAKASQLPDYVSSGSTAVLVSSDQSFLLAGARAVVENAAKMKGPDPDQAMAT